MRVISPPGHFPRKWEFRLSDFPGVTFMELTRGSHCLVSPKHARAPQSYQIRAIGSSGAAKSAASVFASRRTARSYVVGTRFYGLWKPITIGRVGTMSCDSAAELARVALNAASTARGHPAPSRWRYAG